MDYNLPEFKPNFPVLQRILESNILLYCVVCLLALKIITVGMFIDLPFNVFFADITKVTLESLANQTRQSVGLNPLASNPKLDQAAELKAEDMVKNQYFAHTSPTGINPWFWFSRAGYNYKFAGENLAIGFFDSIEVYNAWLNSPSHKANLLNPNYKEIGTAVLRGYGDGNVFVVVQLFGSVQLVKVATVKNTASKPVAVKPNPVKPAEVPVKTDVEPVAEKVLSQSTEAKIQSADSIKLINIYDYAGLLQQIIYGVSLVIIGIIIIMIYSGLDFQIERKLVFRSFLIVAVLGLSLLIDKSVIFFLLPSHILI